MFQVVAYHTDDNLYTEHALLLKASLDRFKIPLHLEKIKQTDWQKTVAFKPKFIQTMLLTYDSPILYIDADAFVRTDPTEYFRSIEQDLSCHYFEDTELLSGTLFFQNTQNAKKIVNNWLELQTKNPLIWDQKTLEQTVKDMNICPHKLPESYCYIFDKGKLSPSQIVIEHLQASRDSKFLRKNQNSHPLRKLIKVNKLNKSYRKFISRRNYVQALAKSIEHTIYFEDL